jgi:hypothetical protein
VAVAVELFPFRYRDPLTGRWVKARYKATPEEIAICFAESTMGGIARPGSPGGNIPRLPREGGVS